ncbi:hypothetical protein A9Q81_03590 [Gammaproteobacteria bacterium 42_54_T18]|nr:hypothetical protein A9Q81_03590 [Gammaproteobacteria bacterium 42_54_T18]
MLEGWEQLEFGLGDEAKLCERNSIEYVSFPIPDRGFPRTDLALVLAEELHAEIRAGKEAFALISDARGVRVPDTEEQENWLGSI